MDRWCNESECAQRDFLYTNLFSYVDIALWEKTRRSFPEEVNKRLSGESIEIPDRELDFSYVQSRQHYGQGELRHEYEQEVRPLHTLPAAGTARCQVNDGSQEGL